MLGFKTVIFFTIFAGNTKTVSRLCARPRGTTSGQRRPHLHPQERLRSHPKRFHHGPVEQQGNLSVHQESVPTIVTFLPSSVMMVSGEWPAAPKNVACFKSGQTSLFLILNGHFSND